MATCVSLSNPGLEQSYKYKVFLVHIQLFPIKIWEFPYVHHSTPSSFPVYFVHEEILKSIYKNLDYNSDVNLLFHSLNILWIYNFGLEGNGSSDLRY